MQIESAHVVALIITAGGVIGYLFKLVLESKDDKFTIITATKDRQLEEAKILIKTYRDIAQEAIAAFADNENNHRKQAGKETLTLPVGVVAEGSSPPSKEQLEAAKLATMRNAMAILKRETGLPPRELPGGDLVGDPIPVSVADALIEIKEDAEKIANKASVQAAEISKDYKETT